MILKRGHKREYDFLFMCVCVFVRESLSTARGVKKSLIYFWLIEFMWKFVFLAQGFESVFNRSIFHWIFRKRTVFDDKFVNMPADSIHMCAYCYYENAFFATYIHNIHTSLIFSEAMSILLAVNFMLIV